MVHVQTYQTEILSNYLLLGAFGHALIINRGGLRNASGPLGIDLPEHEGPLETSPEKGGWFPIPGGFAPASHEAVRLSGVWWVSV